ncbi:hypothetical protein SASPL_111715 [Salvia splendens]|uniref:Uncharacterized protein n=1 Tax=Salvia splendens TaxID=180675 RepID=A0A8X8Y6X0_SALSN|nr:hypothetical protein SASPL_111715 [Salvia splendens]
MAIITTNVAANVGRPRANALVNLSPSAFTFRRGALLTALVGDRVPAVEAAAVAARASCTRGWWGTRLFWRGVILVDYYLIKGTELSVGDLYTMSPEGAYYLYNNDTVHPVAVSRIGYVSDTDTRRIHRRYVSWAYPRAGPYWAGKPSDSIRSPSAYPRAGPYWAFSLLYLQRSEAPQLPATRDLKKIGNGRMNWARSTYYYSGGFNVAAIGALVVGVLPVVPGFLNKLGMVRSVPQAFALDYNNAWFISFFLAAFVYWLMIRLTAA